MNKYMWGLFKKSVQKMHFLLKMSLISNFTSSASPQTELQLKAEQVLWAMSLITTAWGIAPAHCKHPHQQQGLLVEENVLEK